MDDILINRFIEKASKAGVPLSKMFREVRTSFYHVNDFDVIRKIITTANQFGRTFNYEQIRYALKDSDYTKLRRTQKKELVSELNDVQQSKELRSED